MELTSKTRETEKELADDIRKLEEEATKSSTVFNANIFTAGIL